MAKHLGERGRQAQQRRQRRAGQHRLLEGAHPGVRQVHQRAQRRAGQAAPAPRVHLRARGATGCGAAPAPAGVRADLELASVAAMTSANRHAAQEGNLPTDGAMSGPPERATEIQA